MKDFDAAQITIELLNLMKHHGIRDVRLDGLLHAFAADPDQETFELIKEFLVPRLNFSNNFLSVFPKPAPEEIDGPIKLGFTEQRLPVGFDENDKQILVVGRTGSGKSTLLRLIFAQIMKETDNV